MHSPTIHTIDLNFQGIPGAISAFLIPNKTGAVLIECGPGSTLSALLDGLARYDLAPKDISDVFLTHIHLDHAGSAGWWAREGAKIHVHHIGAPHMMNPERLLASATRIYGNMMNQLWGEFLPIPEDRINPLVDNDEIRFDQFSVRVLDTPGHANHHMSYLIGETCFSGDVGGVHLQDIQTIRLPTVPPEFDPDKWLKSINRFRSETISAIAPTHFGIHQDARWHLDELVKSFEEVISWIERIMPLGLPHEEIRNRYVKWIEKKIINLNMSKDEIKAFELAISSQMSADGIIRYWHKNRLDKPM
jgi:glyoxylase-like metal-dependent hydrolase (beta-lactamase superfamily II)